jgi:rhodanese-related sulfurtransferase
MGYSRIQPADLINQKTSASFILDVRTAAEAKASGLPDSLNIPLHELTPERLSAEITQSGKDGSCIYLLCQAGRRAEMAADQLAGHIDAELIVIDGGMDALKQAQIPLQSNGKTVMSLERQVRIAAGFLVLSGVLLGCFVNPNFYFLSGFVGAGLMFAGITDTCMMGMLIARMPWNK